MAFVLFPCLWIILWWYCWLCCRLDRDCSKQQLDVWNSSVDTAVLCAFQRGVKGANRGKKEILFELLFEKQQYLITVQADYHRLFHLKQWFSDPFRDRVWKPNKCKAIGPISYWIYFPLWTKSAESPQEKQQSFAKVQMTVLCQDKVNMTPYFSVEDKRSQNRNVMWFLVLPCQAQCPCYASLEGWYFMTLCLQEYCGLGRKTLPEEGLNSAANHAAAVDHGCKSDYFFFFLN